MKSISQRLSEFTDTTPGQGPSGECHEWTGSRVKRRYGILSLRRSYHNKALAHRVAWEIANAEQVPAGLVVRHKCDNGFCLNPDHLELGTHADNMQDVRDRNRSSRHGKLTPEQREEIRSRRAAGEGIQPLAQEFGVSHQNISYLCK